MSDDIIRARGYAVYKHVLNKALTLLMSAIPNSIITDYKTWDATVVLSVRVDQGQITRRSAKITVKDRPKTDRLTDDVDADTTVIDRDDLAYILTSGEFETAMHTLKDKTSRKD